MIERARPRSIGVTRLVLLGFLLSGTLSGMAAPKPGDNPYLTALRLFAQGKYAAGVKTYYKMMVLANPKLAIEVRNRDLAKARGFFSTHLKTHPGDPRAALGLVLIERIAEDWSAASRRLEALRRKYPTSNLLVFLSGELLLYRNEISEARGFFDRLAANPAAKGLLALARRLLELHQAGLKESPTARKESLLQRAFRHLDLLERELARQAFEQVFQEFPDDPVAPEALVDLFLEENQPEKAENVLSAWAQKSAKPLLPPVKEGRLRYLQGRFDAALELLEKAWQADPANDYVQFLVAESMFQCGRYDSAETHFRKLWSNDLGNVGLAKRLAACRTATGRPEEAAQIYETMLIRTPDDPYLRFELGNLCAGIGQYDKAEAIFSGLADSSEPNRAEAEEALSAIKEIKLRSVLNRKEPASPPPPASNLPAAPGGDGGNPVSGSAIRPRNPGQIDVDALRRLSKMYE